VRAAVELVDVDGGLAELPCMVARLGGEGLAVIALGRVLSG
jgi:hypothetical protein